MIAVFIRQRFTHRQQRHDLFQQLDFYRRIFCNLFRFQHGGNRFPVGLLQLHLKGNAAFKKRLAHENLTINSSKEAAV